MHVLTSSPNNCKLPYIIIEICMLNTNSSMLPQFTTVKYLVGHSFVTRNLPNVMILWVPIVLVIIAGAIICC